jgi:hypothetical protein
MEDTVIQGFTPNYITSILAAIEQNDSYLFQGRRYYRVRGWQ